MEYEELLNEADSEGIYVIENLEFESQASGLINRDVIGLSKCHARLWAYDKMITIEKIISAKKAGCRNRYEIAEHLNVTEPFLQEAIDCYRSKYGLGFQKGEYIILFEPFNICKMAE